MRRIGLLIVVLSFGLTVGCGSYRVIQDWVVPSEYHGWVLVERANPKCPPALLTFTTNTFKVDLSGHGCTSTQIFKGPQYLRVFQLDSTGVRHELRIGSPGNGGQIWQFSNAAEGNESGNFFYATEFFVGTEAEFRSSQTTRPKWWLGRTPDGSASQS
jgi:hypothetical protein